MSAIKFPHQSFYSFILFVNCSRLARDGSIFVKNSIVQLANCAFIPVRHL